MQLRPIRQHPDLVAHLRLADLLATVATAAAIAFGMATAVIGDKLFVINGRAANAPDTVLIDVWASAR